MNEIKIEVQTLEKIIENLYILESLYFLLETILYNCDEIRLEEKIQKIYCIFIDINKNISDNINILNNYV